MGKQPLDTGPLLLLLLLLALISAAHAAGPSSPVSVDVGLVLDTGSKVGRDCRACVEMGFKDFYAKHPNSTTRVALHFRESGNSSIGAASAALDLLKNTGVKAILGPLRSTQASFVIALGNKSHVPIISFSVTSPSLLTSESPYFVRTSLNSSSQVGAIASFVKAFAWREVVVIYEDTEFGSSLLPYLNDALQDVDAVIAYRSVLSPNANDGQVINELNKLKTLQTQVFIVHMLTPVGSLLFQKAKDLGMLSEGFVWISTNGMIDIWDSLDTSTVNSMQGVVGLKPYVPHSLELHLFHVQWNAINKANGHPSIYCLWAYDSAQALAMAIEKVQAKNLIFNVTHGVTVNSLGGLANLGISEGGVELLQEIQYTHFNGTSGPFRIIDGQLQISTFQIVNLLGKDVKNIGFWSQTYGFSQLLNITNNQKYSTSQKDLRNITWPGLTNFTPKGWEIPTKGKALKIGVPMKKGFLQFVNATDRKNVTGYCIDVFEAVLKSLPYRVDYEFYPYQFAQDPGSYDDLVSKVFYKDYDAVVGDVTIRSNRSQYVDFTLPYTESGVAMLVPVKENPNKSGWIFLKPLTWKLWLVSLFALLFTGFVVWVLEHQKNNDFRGPPSHEAGTVFYFAFRTLFFAHSEQVSSNLSRLVMIVWIFVALILTSSYTASLSSMLTFQQMQPAIMSVNELLRNGNNVGYQDGSFVRGILKELKFADPKISNYSNMDAYIDALDKGSANGGVTAIFDEITYIKLFLNGKCAKYTMVPLKSYKAAGFGFVFPKGSLLLPDISRAILNITQGDEIRKIESKWFGDQTDCSTDADATETNKLEFTSFRGLFLITFVVSTLSVMVSFVTYFRCNREEIRAAMASAHTPLERLKVLREHYCSLDRSSYAVRRNDASSAVSRTDALSTRTAGDGPYTPRTSVDYSFSNHHATMSSDNRQETVGSKEPDHEHNGSQ